MLSHQENDAARWRVYEALLQATPDLLYVFDLKHRFIYANEALLTMWGLSWDQAIGKTCLELGYEPWHAAMHDREIERVIATRLPIRGDVPFPHKSKGTRIYDYIFTPVIGMDGEVEAIAGSTRDVTERKQHEQDLQQLINELNHRVKNSLSTVQSLTRQTLKNAEDLDDARDKIEHRLFGLASAYDVLTRGNWQGTEVMELAREVAALYEQSKGACFHLEGEACRLEPKRAVALSMALHELSANALKHGALSVAGGIVEITWQRRHGEQGDVLALRWLESGGPRVLPPAKSGFGSRLLERGLKHDLGGDVEWLLLPQGVMFQVTIPLPSAPGQVAA